MKQVYEYWQISNSLYKKNHRKLAKMIYIFMRVVFGCDIPYTAHIGKRTVFKHYGLGVVINPDAIIGENCRIYQNVSIAGRSGQQPPIIEDDVLIGAHALVLGNIHIGKGAQIGAGAVVLHDVEADAVVVGNPAREIKRKNV